MTAAEVHRLVQEELERTLTPAEASALQALLVAPRPERLTWEYGAPGTTAEAWIVGQSPDGRIALAYTTFGFGPEHPWGMVFLEQRAFGMDCQWYAHLREAAGAAGLLSVAPKGPIEPGARSLRSN